MKRKLTAVIEQHGKWYVAYIKEIPGVNTQGRTVSSTLRNLADAFRGVMEVRQQLHGAGLKAAPTKAKRQKK